MRPLLEGILKILLLRCEEADRLLSDETVRSLRWWERTALEAHVLGCRACRRSRQQMRILQQAMRRYRQRLEAEGTSMLDSLSPEARRRIQQALNDSG